jgi:hypothetical protein
MAIFNRLLLWIGVFVTCALCSGKVSAADVRMDPSQGVVAAGAIFEGPIQAGDFEKFKTFILNGGNAVQIYLASPGGDLAEAMKIGLLVRLLKLSTVVPGKTLTNQAFEAATTEHNLTNPKADYLCTSACFFIFVAGVHRSHDDRGPPLLGIHRPKLTADTLKKLSSDQAIAADGQARKMVENYLTAMGVPAKYAEIMYSEPGRRIRWIMNDDFEADFDGFIPQVRDWVDARCDKRGDIKNNGMQLPKAKTTAEQVNSERSVGTTPMGRHREELSCQKQAQVDLALGAYEEVIKKRNGQTAPLTPDSISPAHAK